MGSWKPSTGWLKKSDNKFHPLHFPVDVHAYAHEYTEVTEGSQSDASR